MGGDGDVEIGKRIGYELWPGSKTQCDLPDFPQVPTLIGAVGFNTAQGPVICGGFEENRCFILKQHQWMHFLTMKTKRGFASATEVKNDQILIIGGYDENYDYSKSTEMISSSGAKKGKDFPVSIAEHCTFKINTTHALVTGSWNSWFVDLTTETFTPGPTMKTNRAGHGCAAFNLGRKTYGILVGGKDEDWKFSNPSIWYLDSTEWIDLNEDSPIWTEGIHARQIKNSLSLPKVFS